MNKNYDLKEIFELLVSFEKDLSYLIYNSGNEAWPIVRMTLWRILINIRDEKKTAKNKSKLFYFHPFIKLMKNILLNIYNPINKFTKDIDNTEIIFFSRSIYLEKLSSGLLVDRIIDPIYEVTRSDKNTIKFYIDKLKSGQLYFDSEKYSINNLNILNLLNIIEISKLQNYSILLAKEFIKLNKLHFLEKEIISEVKKAVILYFIAKNNTKSLFKKFKSLKKIFITSWYFSDMMGIIAAARDIGVESIEIQHGKQGKFQAAYSGWNKIPDNGFKNMPDKFWCWNKQSTINILKSSPKRKNHIPFVGGYSWPKWYKNNVNIITPQKIKNNCIRLIFTMQVKQGKTIIEPLDDGLLELLYKYDLINKNNNNNIDSFKLRIRLHPNSINSSIDYLKSRLKELYNSEILEITSKNKSCFYDDLQWSTHHLTCFSSCSIEATLFNVRSAVYGIYAYEIYQEEIENKSLKYFEKLTYNNLNSWLNDNDNNIQRVN
tara:strand:+ start:12429 stop:13895 length:1467 start_codon:yes stop_codon:yes gene_type:complete